MFATCVHWGQKRTLVILLHHSTLLLWIRVSFPAENSSWQSPDPTTLGLPTDLWSDPAFKHECWGFELSEHSYTQSQLHSPCVLVFLSFCWKYPWVNLLLLTLLISENGLYVPFLHFLIFKLFLYSGRWYSQSCDNYFCFFHLNHIRYDFTASCSSCLCPCLLFLWTTLSFPLSAGLSNSSTMSPHP